MKRRKRIEMKRGKRIEMTRGKRIDYLFRVEVEGFNSIFRTFDNTTYEKKLRLGARIMISARIVLSAEKVSTVERQIKSISSYVKTKNY